MQIQHFEPMSFVMKWKMEQASPGHETACQINFWTSLKIGAIPKVFM